MVKLVLKTVLLCKNNDCCAQFCFNCCHFSSFSLKLEEVTIQYTHSHIRLFVTPWTVAHQDPLSMEFSRQEYWSGLPFPSPGNLPNPGIKPRISCIAGRFFST